MKGHSRAPSLLALNEVLPLFGALAVLMLLISLGVLSTFFYVDPPRYAENLVLICQMALVGAGAVAGQSGLGDLCRILRARAAPLEALRAAVSRLRRHALQFWLLCSASMLSIAIGVLVASYDLDWSRAAAQLTAGPALLALMLIGCTAATAAWQGRASALTGGLGLLLVLGCLPCAHGDGFARWRDAGWMPHAAAMLMLAPALDRLLTAAVGQRRAMSALRDSLRERLARWKRRWRFIDRQARFGAFAFAWLLAAHLPTWGEPFGAHGSARLCLLTLLAGVLLRSRDLHWRRQLAPGGARRSRLGLRVAVDSLLGTAIVVLLSGIAYLALALMPGLGSSAPNPQRALAQMSSSGALLLAELVPATLLAVCLRGIAGSRAAGVVRTLILLTLAFAPLLMPRLEIGRDFALGPAYLLALAAASLALTPLVQRCWLKVDLARLAREAMPEDPDAA